MAVLYQCLRQAEAPHGTGEAEGKGISMTTRSAIIILSGALWLSLTSAANAVRVFPPQTDCIEIVIEQKARNKVILRATNNCPAALKTIKVKCVWFNAGKAVFVGGAYLDNLAPGKTDWENAGAYGFDEFDDVTCKVENAEL